MSVLGNIYDINLETQQKSKYPVVYENVSYYFCKSYGTDELRKFSKNSVLTIEKFNYNYDKLINNCEEVLVFAPNKIKNIDDNIISVTKEHLTIVEAKRLKNKYITAQRNYDYTDNNIKQYSKKLNELCETLTQYENDIITTRKEYESFVEAHKELQDVEL